MGLRFGELYKGIRGIVYYSLSPHEQKAYAKAISHGLPNIINRTFPDIFYWLPPMLIGYTVYYTANELHHRASLKDPQDFADEQPPESEAAPCKKKAEEEAAKK